jgi:hypothetical protein
VDGRHGSMKRVGSNLRVIGFRSRLPSRSAMPRSITWQGSRTVKKRSALGAWRTFSLRRKHRLIAVPRGSKDSNQLKLPSTLASPCAGRADFCHFYAKHKLMKRSISDKQKRRGRPATGITPMIGIRLSPDKRKAVEAWAKTALDKPSLSEAVRRLLELGLASAHRSAARMKKAMEASEMAGQELDHLGDASANDEERQRRKGKLIKGPKELRDIRRHRPKGQ